MIISPKQWLKWASQLAPKERRNWIEAMKAELSQIDDYKTREKFAFGCFRAALTELLRSRKGLNYAARIGGAILILMMCAYGIISGARLGSAPETLALSKPITGLCVFYMAGAGLLMASLKGLQIYASLGLGASAGGWIYCLLIRPSFDHLSTEFLTALTLEATGFMAGLLLASIYLDLLYSPEVHDA